MKIALAQIDVISNYPNFNIKTIERFVKDSKLKNADLVVFPELCVSGYLLGDLFTNESYCKSMMEYDQIIKNLSSEYSIAIAYGNIYLDYAKSGYHPNKDGRIRKYNSLRVYQNGAPVSRVKESILPEGVSIKTLLPNYRIFDDQRYFFSSEDVAKDFSLTLQDLLQPFIIKVGSKNVAVGFEICEDLWCSDYRSNLKSINPTKILIENGAEVIVNLSASPWTYGKNNARDKRIFELKKDIGSEFKPFIYVNCAGMQNNGKNFVVFDGGSTVYNNSGLPILMSSKSFEEDLLIYDTDKDYSSLERDLGNEMEQKYNALICAIRHFKDLFGIQKKFVIGLSGGVDSAVVCALICDAIGKDAIEAYNMPSKFNSSKTMDAAKHISDKLGITLKTISIESIVTSIRETFDKNSIKYSDFNLENMQAKVRGTDLLSNISSIQNAVFTNNGNKLEVALGYATLYGDVGGAISVIGDCTKKDVFDLAKYINKKHGDEIIPNSLIPDNMFRFSKDQIKPSAELAKDQVDPMKFGYHDALLQRYMDYNKASIEDVARWYLDGKLDVELGITKEMISEYGLDKSDAFIEDLEWFDLKFRTSVFKRIQSPPIILITKSAFGYDLRESILPYHLSESYIALRNQILNRK